MGEIQELKDVVAQQVRQAAEAQGRVDALIAEMARLRAPPGVPAADGVVPVPDPDAIVRAAAAARADKLSKLGISLRKSYKVREFKDNNENSVKEWLTRLDQEIVTLKKMSGIVEDLTREELVELFKDRLEYQVVKRLDTAFAAKNPVWTWAEVTYDELKAIMKEEYGSRMAEVSEVLVRCYHSLHLADARRAVRRE